MKKILLFAFLVLAPLFAQEDRPVRYFPNDPSVGNPCNVITPMINNWIAGRFWQCVGTSGVGHGVWKLVSQAIGGPFTPPEVSVNFVPGSAAQVYGPDGLPVSTVGTTTCGLQEAENYAKLHSYNTVYRGYDAYPLPACSMTSMLTLGPAEARSWRAEGAFTISCATPTGTFHCIKLDSFEIAVLDWRSVQIEQQGKGSCLLVKPTNSVPLDLLFGIGFYGAVDIFTCVNTHPQLNEVANVPLVDFDATLGPITYSRFHIQEINASGIGIRVVDPTSGKTFYNNKIDSDFIHSLAGGSNPAVQVGQTAVGGARIELNEWNILIGDPNSNTGKMYDTYEQKGIGTIRVNVSNAPTYGLFFETGATANWFKTPILTGSTNLPNSNVSAGGDCYVNRIDGLDVNGLIQGTVTAGASPWTYRNNDCRPETMILTGAGISAIEMGSLPGNVVNTGLLAGSFMLAPGQVIKTTYTGSVVATRIMGQ